MGWKKIKLGEVLIKKNLRLKDVPDLKNPLVIGVTNDEGVVKSKVNAGQKIEDYYVVEKGDFIYNPYRINVGSIGISDLEGITSLAYVVFKVDETRLNKYLLYKFLKSDLGIKEIIRNGRGSVRNALRFDDLAKIELTLPSIEVQNAFVENFKKKEEKLELLKQHYSYQLTQLENLNQAILQEAVQGKLVKQDPKDEPASELLKRIKAEKATLRQAQGKGKKEKPLRPIKPEEIPFEIPENWVWCRLGEICSKIGSGSTPKGSNYSKRGFPFFRSQNIYNEGLVYDDIKFVSDEVQKQMNGTIVLANDILLNITGGSMGRCALVPEDFKEGNVSQHVCIIRPLQVDRNYFHKIVLSPYFQKFIFSSTTGAGREGLPKYNLEQFAIPLPPLSEQKRIVAEIEKQLAKTKQLKEHIIANQQATEQLLKALLHQAFEVKEMEEVNS